MQKLFVFLLLVSMIGLILAEAGIRGDVGQVDDSGERGSDGEADSRGETGRPGVPGPAGGSSPKGFPGVRPCSFPELLIQIDCSSRRNIWYYEEQIQRCGQMTGCFDPLGTNVLTNEDDCSRQCVVRPLGSNEATR